jgi:hypothetical protein
MMIQHVLLVLSNTFCYIAPFGATITWNGGGVDRSTIRLAVSTYTHGKIVVQGGSKQLIAPFYGYN